MRVLSSPSSNTDRGREGERISQEKEKMRFQCEKGLAIYTTIDLKEIKDK